MWPILQNSIVDYGKSCVIYSCGLKCVVLCEMWILLCCWYCCADAIAVLLLLCVIFLWGYFLSVVITKLGHPWQPNLECDLKRNKPSKIMHPKFKLLKFREMISLKLPLYIFLCFMKTIIFPYSRNEMT